MPSLPTPATMYRAFVRRDPAYEGVFWLGVRTTGIFCRPTCRARTPNRENVEFFGAPSEALHAGYRPCRKCRPLDQGRKPPPLVERLLLAVETEPGRRYRDAELLELGIDPSTARRQFKAYCGMTFQAYHRARRMGLALLDIRKGKDRARRATRPGLRIRQRLSRSLQSTRRHRAITRAGYRRAAGQVAGNAAGRDAGVGRRSRAAPARLRRPARTRSARCSCCSGGCAPGCCPVRTGIWRRSTANSREYFSGTRRTFDTPVVLTGSAFQTSVWQALRTIPSGKTRSYAELARMIGNPKAVRAVGRANGDNRLSIIVPCHRVIGADGALTGYGGGLARKQKLLDLERAGAG